MILNIAIAVIVIVIVVIVDIVIVPDVAITVIMCHLSLLLFWLLLFQTASNHSELHPLTNVVACGCGPF